MSITITGTAVACDGTAITNGYVMVNSGISYYNTRVLNGSFTITFPICTNLSSAARIIIVDEANSRESQSQVINISNGGQNIGQITACIDFRDL